MADIMSLRTMIKENVRILDSDAQGFQFVHTYDDRNDIVPWNVSLVTWTGMSTVAPIEFATTAYRGYGSTIAEVYEHMLKKTARSLLNLGY